MDDNATLVDAAMEEEGVGLHEVAETMTRLRMFPFFEAAHYILACLLVREDHYSNYIAGAKGFHRSHPLACWVGSMLLCFSPSLVSCLLLAQAPLLDHHLHLTTASIVWYLVNYCPLDLVYQAVKFMPVHGILLVMEEVLRVSRIREGCLFAHLNFPGAFNFVCLFACLRGTAVLHMRLLQRLACGKWSPSEIEVLGPSPLVKAGLVASICFGLLQRGDIELASHLLFFFIVIFFLVVKFFWILFSVDVFKLFENLICFIFFGGFLGWLERRRHRKEFEHLGQDSKGKKLK